MIGSEYRKWSRWARPATVRVTALRVVVPRDAPELRCAPPSPRLRNRKAVGDRLGVLGLREEGPSRQASNSIFKGLKTSHIPLLADLGTLMHLSLCRVPGRQEGLEVHALHLLRLHCQSCLCTGHSH